MLRSKIDGLDSASKMLGRNLRNYSCNIEPSSCRINHHDYTETFFHFKKIKLAVPKEIIELADDYEVVELGESIFNKTLNIFEETLSTPMLEIKNKKPKKVSGSPNSLSFFQHVANHSMTNREIKTHINRYKNITFFCVGEGLINRSEFGIRPGDAILAMPTFGLNMVGLDFLVKKKPNLKNVPGIGYVFATTDYINDYVANELYLNFYAKRIIIPQIGLLPALEKLVPYGGRIRLNSQEIYGLVDNKFKAIAWDLNISKEEIFQYFTSGIGMIIVASPKNVKQVERICRNSPVITGEPVLIGEFVESNRGPKVTVS